MQQTHNDLPVFSYIKCQIDNSLIKYNKNLLHGHIYIYFLLDHIYLIVHTHMVVTQLSILASHGYCTVSTEPWLIIEFKVEGNFSHVWYMKLKTDKTTMDHYVRDTQSNYNENVSDLNEMTLVRVVVKWISIIFI